MAHFAKVENGQVTQVIVADRDFIDSGALGDPTIWIQTSYNTRSGVHYGVNGEPDGGVALRKNYAGIGYSYDSVRDAFVPSKPFASWALDEDTCLWSAPVAMPQDGNRYVWNEDTGNWTQVDEQLGS